MSREAAAFVVAAASDLGACVCEDDATVSEWNDLSALIDLIDAREATIRVQAEQIAALQEALERCRAILRGVVEAERRDRVDGAYCVQGDSFLGIHLALLVDPYLAEGCAAPADEEEK